MIKRTTPFKRSALIIAAALGVSLPWGSDAEAHRHGPLELHGRLLTEQVDCDSLCTQGPLSGGLAGTLHFTMDSLDDTDTPNVARYQGVNVVRTRFGTLSGPDYGVWNLKTGRFVDYTEFTSGTGIYAGLQGGSLTIAGTFDPVTGAGSSHYTATLDLR